MAGALTWDRPVRIKAILLASSFVGIDVATGDPEVQRGEDYVVKMGQDIQDLDAGVNNLVTGTNLIGGPDSFQRVLDNVILAHTFCYAAADTALSKSSGIVYAPEDAWVLRQNERIACFQSGNFLDNVLRSIVTVHFDYEV